METEDLAILNRTFVTIIPLLEVAPNIFHERLLLLEPELSRMWSQEDPLPVESLTKSLALMLQTLSEPSKSRRLAQFFGFRYRQLGLEPRHYASVEDAMVWTLGNLLGDGMGRAEEQAWRRGFAVILQGLKEGALQGAEGAHRLI